ncbi:sensor histidine kinase (plasmid) [Agrobacterium tumefaciens]|nr:sensor histidine kinase [Agrobacterium tumefaciens]CUX67584.1 Histidine kinase [Agrobacterium genomosp. 5 str. CFBP 6626]
MPVRTAINGLIIAVAALLCGLLSWHVSRSAMINRLDQSLILSRHALTVEIERFRYLPAVAGEDARIRSALRAPDDGAAILSANGYLETLVQTSGATHLYLLDASGVTIAASNWKSPESFMGQDYSFRPYFKDALNGGSGAFYAIGVTTRLPGYFLSARVVLPDGITGIVVVKIDLSPLRDTWNRVEQDIAVTDTDGVIFLASDPDWLYRPLMALSPAVLARLKQVQTYSGIDIAAAQPLKEGAFGLINSKNKRMLVSRLTAMEPDWQMLAATPVTAVASTAGLGALAGALLAAMALGWAKIRRQRRALLEMERHHAAVLEQRVTERTAALNREVEVRCNTEAELRAAQESLIQAEKMAALGRMSTAIVHEISQPLAAMEATLLTATMMAEAAAPDARQRIETARGLVRRMQRTTKRLKSFARKEVTETEPVDLMTVIEGAMEVIQPRARTAGVMPELRTVAASCRVQAGRGRMEQVLVNLLVNALDAVEGRQGAKVEVELVLTPDEALIAVEDNGPGIDPQVMQRVSEPFFTTKSKSEGLGLGLAISSEIITSFGGRIDLDPRAGGGLCASIRLPRLEREDQ